MSRTHAIIIIIVVGAFSRSMQTHYLGGFLIWASKHAVGGVIDGLEHFRIKSYNGSEAAIQSRGR